MLAVHASEDVNFEEKDPEVAAVKVANVAAFVYRNRWASRLIADAEEGLMGMDYIPSMKANRTRTHRSRSAQANCKSWFFRPRSRAHSEYDGSCTGHRSGRRTPQIGRIAAFQLHDSVEMSRPARITRASR